MKAKAKKVVKVRKSEAVEWLSENYTSAFQLLNDINAQVGKKNAAGKFLTQQGVTAKIAATELLHTGEGKKARFYKLVKLTAKTCDTCAHKGDGAWGRNVYRFNDTYYVLVKIKLTFADVLQSIMDAQRIATATTSEYSSTYGVVYAAPRKGKYTWRTLFSEQNLAAKDAKIAELNAQMFALQERLKAIKG